MNIKLTERVNIYLGMATLVVTLILCTIVPFITFPKPTINAMKYTWDFFVYYKAIAQYILAILALIIILGRAVTGFIMKDPIKIKISLLLFTLWVAVSTYFARDHNFAFFGNKLECQGLLAYICYFIFFTIVNNTFNNKHLRIFVYITLASSFLMSLLCLFEFYDIQIIKFNLSTVYQFTTQVHATFGNSNNVGSYFSLMLPLAMMMFLRSKNRNESITLAFITMANIAGLIVSTSRIAWISVLICLVFCMFFIDERRLFYKKTIAMIVFVVAATLVLDLTGGHIIREKTANMINQTEKAFKSDIRQFGSSRLYAYEKFIKLALDNPVNALVGVGPDCLLYYGWASEEDTKKYPSMAGSVFTKAHSEPIEYAASMGIPALIFYICFIISILFPWIKRINGESPEMTGVFAAWLGYLLQSFFNMATIGILLIFFVFSAIIDKKADRKI